VVLRLRLVSGWGLMKRRSSSSSSYLFSDNNMTQYHKNSHTIGGPSEKPYSSLTGRPSKKINCPQIILSCNKQNTNNDQRRPMGFKARDFTFLSRHNAVGNQRVTRSVAGNAQPRVLRVRYFNVGWPNYMTVINYS